MFFHSVSYDEERARKLGNPWNPLYQKNPVGHGRREQPANHLHTHDEFSKRGEDGAGSGFLVLRHSLGLHSSVGGRRIDGVRGLLCRGGSQVRGGRKGSRGEGELGLSAINLNTGLCSITSLGILLCAVAGKGKCKLLGGQFCKRKLKGQKVTKKETNKNNSGWSRALPHANSITRQGTSRG